MMARTKGSKSRQKVKVDDLDSLNAQIVEKMNKKAALEQEADSITTTIAECKLRLREIRASLKKLEKNIPVCAGTAGGSSDAAAVLRGLNELTGAGLSRRALAEIGARVGSDVPYCVLGGTMLAEGRGEILTPLPPLPACFIVLCKPAFSISTPVLFRAWDRQKKRLRPDTDGLIAALEAGDLAGVAQRVYNVFETVLPANQRREIDRIKNTLIQSGALGASMTGSGPTVFGIFRGQEPAKEAAGILREQYHEVFSTHPV